MGKILDLLRKRRRENIRMSCIANFKMAKEDLQPIVWEGKLYVAFRGEPILEIAMLKEELVVSIEEMQKILGKYRNYKITNN